MAKILFDGLDVLKMSRTDFEALSTDTQIVSAYTIDPSSPERAHIHSLYGEEPAEAVAFLERAYEDHLAGTNSYSDHDIHDRATTWPTYVLIYAWTNAFPRCDMSKANWKHKRLAKVILRYFGFPKDILAAQEKFTKENVKGPFSNGA